MWSQVLHCFSNKSIEGYQRLGNWPNSSTSIFLIADPTVGHISQNLIVKHKLMGDNFTLLLCGSYLLTFIEFFHLRDDIGE